jgi:hypothetical protein
MNAASNSRSSVGKMILNLIILILLAVALYYLYYFLFGTDDLEQKTLIRGIVDAHKSGTGNTLNAPVGAFLEGFPVIRSGGEYTMNFWVYINDFKAYGGLGRAKHILSLGGATSGVGASATGGPTVLIYLGAYNNKLSVRVKANALTTGMTTDVALTDPTAPGSISSPIVDEDKPCDIPNIDMQKWVQVTVCLNNKVCDVYMDGKLARSCVLPASYQVTEGVQMIEVAKNQGFGGFLSNVSVFNYALNPEQVWRLYMTGPGPQYSLMDYLKSLFNPGSLGTFDFPKQNITS